MKTIATLFAAALLLAGCGGSSEDEPDAPATAAAPSAPAPATTASTAAPEPAGATVKIQVADGKVTPQGGRVEVKVGEEVRLVITSDADEEIHVHSEPEHTYEVKAGQQVTESFTVDNPGQVAVEAHELGVTIVQLVVRP